ncbi:hypothetical protein MRB53_014636 [Persea americana]|uniref:Uncharacterized protein n=1 Tax=Persea americana TaxID=3435 RepID=A0ACC2KBF4_PERAE|nr:hypothetical protein MRB53_014636 [Persea americana]
MVSVQKKKEQAINARQYSSDLSTGSCCGNNSKRIFQLLPEQAAIRMNHATKFSAPAKSPKGFSGMLLPGHESYPENSNSVRMSPLVAKLIFHDQLCEFSPYLARSTLELHVPYAILRSIYRQYYANSRSSSLALLSPSPRQSPAISLAHPSPTARQFRGDTTPQSNDWAIGVQLKPESEIRRGLNFWDHGPKPVAEVCSVKIWSSIVEVDIAIIDKAIK